MKNLHLLPTYKPSRLFKDQDSIYNLHGIGVNQDIYITSDEEIKDCWVLNTHSNQVYFLKGFYGIQPITKKIILTTDTDLISDGVQAIDDDFLEWFVQNPSCEYVNITTYGDYLSLHHSDSFHSVYKIIIPKGCDRKPKQETLEEAALKYSDGNTLEFAYMQEIPAFKAGAEWQAERMYSEEEVLEIIALFVNDSPHNTKEWFEQFQKK